MTLLETDVDEEAFLWMETSLQKTVLEWRRSMEWVKDPQLHRSPQGTDYLSGAGFFYVSRGDENKVH